MQSTAASIATRATRRVTQRGSVDAPIRNSSTARAHWRPSRIAHTTSDWPRRMSPAAKTFGDRRAVVVGVGLDVAARVALDAELRRAARRAPGPTKPIASSTRSALISNSLSGHLDHPHRAAAVALPFDARGDRASRPCRRALEALGRDRPVALAAFLVRRRRAQLDRPVRPHQRLVLALGRLRQQLELRDRRRALAVRRADAVGAGVAAADDDDVLARGDDLVRHARRRRRPGSAAAGIPSRNGRRRGRGRAPAGRAAARRRR